jgi:hypothetical protein
MRRINKKLWVLGLIVLLTACQSSYNVVQVSPDALPSNRDGMFYALPRTFVNIEITITKTDYFKGPYAEFAERYLGLKGVEIQNFTRFEISDVTFKTYTEPDPEHYYFVEFGKRGFDKSALFTLGLTEAGLIQSVNEPAEKVDVEKTSYSRSDYLIDNSKTFFFPGANVYEKVDTIIEQITVDTLIVEKQTLKRTLVEKTTDQKAREAADFINKIRDNRFNMITGFQEVAYEKATIQFMYESLEELEKEYVKLFTGLTTTSTLKYRFSYLPEGNVYNFSMPLFKFSSKHGIVMENHPYGEMVYVVVERGQNTVQLEPFVKKLSEIKRKKHGFYYRIPEYAKFSLKQGITTKAEATFLISQFGVIHSLPPGKSKLLFYGNSGAVKTAGAIKERLED